MCEHHNHEEHGQNYTILRTLIALALFVGGYKLKPLFILAYLIAGGDVLYKALKNELAKVLEQLERIEAGGNVSRDLLDTIELITNTMQGMKDEKSL